MTNLVNEAAAHVSVSEVVDPPNKGRHQGGYQTVDAGPHPNPRKAAEGYRLRVLAVDEDAAEVVRRIFADYLDGLGDRAIANRLNRDGIPCPSALLNADDVAAGHVVGFRRSTPDRIVRCGWR